MIKLVNNVASLQGTNISRKKEEILEKRYPSKVMFLPFFLFFFLMDRYIYTRQYWVIQNLCTSILTAINSVTALKNEKSQKTPYRVSYIIFYAHSKDLILLRVACSYLHHCIVAWFFSVAPERVEKRGDDKGHFSISK